ncbi:MAG: dihydroneopterin aldolase [Rhodobacteraceae bacterium GWE1_64_9]|nr:MAG: dihydroneopterin aldolase [Rhodobacteraceae bacterium GWE1_64_9]OHC50390.1 MAG: dihydroneopterin aldolase [Rhodobacteraceae bacterium GWF1_65_7]HBU15239.1 disulfide bond formation protein B [Gemmobacter sp.]
MYRNRLIAGFAAAGSALLLLGALAFQYFGGLAPCALCIWQRWPHLVAVAIGVLFVLLGWRWLLVLGALAAAASAAIGVFHVGVEQAWWEGLQSCTGNSIAGLNTADLLNPAVDVAPVARCTDIAWAMFGISMAGWNVLISAGLAVIWLLALRKK